jgi:hypothetical protein
VPELVGKGSLLLNLTTVADIMLGLVDNWNHSAIRELNPALAQYLPNAPIIVVTPTGAPTVMLLLTQALSQASESFRDIVRTVLEMLTQTHVTDDNVKLGWSWHQRASPCG